MLSTRSARTGTFHGSTTGDHNRNFGAGKTGSPGKLQALLFDGRISSNHSAAKIFSTHVSNVSRSALASLA
ncbi:MAG: hypothetical protein HQL64_06405 [Magnetococcales bacterium]|nr:hypothetical protein [Magnetococcales bacterium]